MSLSRKDSNEGENAENSALYSTRLTRYEVLVLVVAALLVGTGTANFLLLLCDVKYILS